MKALQVARLVWLRFMLAIGEWRVRRMARAIEQAHLLPPGWLLIPGNAQRFSQWEQARQRRQPAPPASHSAQMREGRL